MEILTWHSHWIIDGDGAMLVILIGNSSSVVLCRYWPFSHSWTHNSTIRHKSTLRYPMIRVKHTYRLLWEPKVIQKQSFGGEILLLLISNCAHVIFTRFRQILIGRNDSLSNFDLVLKMSGAVSKNLRALRRSQKHHLVDLGGWG